MIDPNITPDWLKLSSEPMKTRKRREAVTMSQKEFMFEFISGNPELITHSSTKACEIELWTELTKKINDIQPSKSFVFWRLYWKRWMDKVLSKSEASLTVLDSKVKKFLTNLGISECTERVGNKENKIMKIKDTNLTLKDLEAEKVQLTLDIDRIDCKIVQCKTNLKQLSRLIHEKRKRLKEIRLTKKLLNEKKNIEEEEERETSSSDSDG